MIHTLLVCTFICVSLSVGNISNASEDSAFEHPDAKTYNEIAGEYARLINTLMPSDSSLKSFYDAPLVQEKIWLTDPTLDSLGSKIWLAALYQPLELTFYHSPLKLRSVHNYALEEYLKAHKEQRQMVPALTVEQATAKGREYFKTVGFVLPPSYRLDTVDFNSSNPSMWTLRWQRYAGDYAYDTTNQLMVNDAVISFHETLGIGTCGVHSYLPEPTSLDVKVDRENAILKASKAVPLIQDSPYYLQARVPGFVVKSLLDCSLCVAVPNWLLDPERAVWIYDHVPKEVRLCWVVRFTSVNSKPEPDPKYQLVPPKFIIYIDAKTGEVVGVDFT